MHAFTLQDWTTIRAQSGIQTITQGEDGWIDLSPYQDVIFWIDCRESSGSSTPAIQFQTSPCKEDATFQGMLSAGVTMTAQSTPQVSKALMSSATTPIARYVRWQLSGPLTGGWDATFRILLSANSPGM